jgi:hypothetical protein
MAALLTACAATQEVREVTPAGFHGDYSILRPGQEGEAALVYRNPDARFGAYDKVLVDPVTVWTGTDSDLGEVPAEDRQTLANDLYGKLVEALQADYQIVTTPGRGVLRISAAITRADVDAAFDYWSQKLSYRLCQESGRGGCAAPTQ